MQQQRNSTWSSGVIGKLALQLLVPALVAALSSYVAVSVRLTEIETRQEERFASLSRELQLRGEFIERELTGLHATDKQLMTELHAVVKRGGHP